MELHENVVRKMILKWAISWGGNGDGVEVGGESENGLFAV